MAGVENRVAMVTGGGRGIGLATANLLAERGAKVAEYGGSAYNSSKAGLLGLMQSVAEDCGEFGITSNAVLPGWVRTEMAEKHAAAEALERDVSTEQVWQERAALYRAGRVATPDEVAVMIAFLASDEVSGVSGEAIRVSLGGVM